MLTYTTVTGVTMHLEKDTRRDPLTGRRTIFFPQSTGDLRLTLKEWADGLTPKGGESNFYTGCFCCPGNTSLTNMTICEVNTGHGNIRVTTSREIQLESSGRPRKRGRGEYDCSTPYGTDEAVIIGDHHDPRLTTIPVELLTEALLTSRQRVADLLGNPVLSSFLIWCDGNQIDRKIGTYFHPRFHISSRDTVLRRVEDEMDGFHRFYYIQDKERCLLCDIIRSELEENICVIAQSDHFLVWAPYAARYPFEIWIAPLQHFAFFDRSHGTDEHCIRLIMSELAGLTQEVLRKLEILFGPRVPFTATIHTGPRRFRSLKEESIGPAYHWRLRIVPHLGPASAYERSLGETEHVILPEVAADILRRTPEDITAWLNG